MSLSRFPGPIAIIDVETTGLFRFRNDRVVEVAAVVIDGNGQTMREFASLVNPARDIGPSSIHGLTSEDILNAPAFDEIAALLVDVLAGTIAIAAHNVTFDQQFLESEFSRIDCPLPEYAGLCTMRLAGGGRLIECCGDYGIPFDGEAHHALADARATAQLLATLLAEQPRAVEKLANLSPIQWPSVRRTEKQPITRDESRRRQAEPPTYLQRLLEQKHNCQLLPATDGAVMAYTALLDRVLEDRCIDDSEGDGLLEMATMWGLSGNQVRLAHRDYINQLTLAALADGVITDPERRDLKLVARLLGYDQHRLDEILAEAAAKLASLSINGSSAKVTDAGLAGSRVCFTGEMQCSHQGKVITREHAMELATKAGLEVVDAVNKKLDLLVVTDPLSQSGKAKKARQYNIRIMHEPVFWKALGVEVT